MCTVIICMLTHGFFMFRIARKINGAIRLPAQCKAFKNSSSCSILMLINTSQMCRALFFAGISTCETDYLIAKIKK